MIIDGKPGLIELTTASFDLALSTTTDTFDCYYLVKVSYGLIKDSGTYGSAYIHGQCSVDDTNWYSIPASTLTADGIVDNLNITVKYFRIAVGTLAGSVGSATVLIQGK